MRVLVTGGAGFIGSHAARALVLRGDSVRILDDFSAGDAHRLDGLAGVDVVRGDIRDKAALARALEGVDGVLHLAAQVSVPRSVAEPELTADINVMGTLRLLEACQAANARRFVLASSCAVYGDGAAPSRESDSPRPSSPYASSKLAGESLVAAHAHAGLGAVALRFFNVVGAGQGGRPPHAAAVPAFAAAIRDGRPVRLFGDGLQERDLVHVDDVVAALLLALEAPVEAAGRAFNVGTGTATTMLDLARRVGETLGLPVGVEHAPSRAGDLRFSRADTSLAKDALGFEARVTLVDGLKRSL